MMYTSSHNSWNVDMGYCIHDNDKDKTSTPFSLYPSNSIELVSVFR